MTCSIKVYQKGNGLKNWLALWEKILQVKGCLDLGGTQPCGFDEMYVFYVGVDVIAGFILMKNYTSSSSGETIKYIDQMCTANDHKKKGFASYMVSEILIKNKGLTVGAYAVNDASKSMFSKLNFRDMDMDTEKQLDIFNDYELYINFLKKCDDDCLPAALPTACNETIRGGKPARQAAGATRRQKTGSRPPPKSTPSPRRLACPGRARPSPVREPLGASSKQPGPARASGAPPKTKRRGILKGG